ncbi:small acid-soluble spore protein Tlp [Paenibacillus terrigena]|uniref:small acid-soluble spore protein Tlp n=1 Tax=Paenibacillus terrigena TaxID=369333 RepID=UPI0028D20C20|nr:small acid-soluble spore protein Tlp [Paenibacillus terrigena]
MAKPDDRSDNAEKIQNAIQNTKQNMAETNQYLDEHADEISGKETSQLEHKNEKRKAAIRGLADELQDEQ